MNAFSAARLALSCSRGLQASVAGQMQRKRPPNQLYVRIVELRVGEKQVQKPRSRSLGPEA
eukprot:5549918-Karenia_brevis.AAC.1